MEDKKENQKQLDQILEAEIAAGFRIKELPEKLQAQLVAYELPPFKRFRFTRLNPSRKRNMHAAIQKAYFRDLKDQELLSNKQIMELVVERGEWSPENDERVSELKESTNTLMAELWRDGFVEDTSVWISQLEEQRKIVIDAIEAMEAEQSKKDELLRVFDRWSDYTPEMKDTYSELYAEEQGRTTYSFGKDAQTICDTLPALPVVDAINEIELLLDKIQRFTQLVKERQELGELENKRLSIFADSVESRKEIAEEMARLYFSVEKVSDNDAPQGPIMQTFDALWELPQDVIDFLLTEAFFFHQGIPDEARSYLETFGFIRGGAKENTDSEASEESPALPSSNPDSPPVTTTEENSSVTTAVTISTTSSSA